MAIIKKGRDIDTRYEKIMPMCKVLWRIFKLLAYIAAGLTALLAIMSLVLLFVDVSAEELLFTPYMKLITEGDKSTFDVRLGNGIEVFSTNVNTDNIKGTVYAGIFTLMAALAVCVPIFNYLGKLFKNVGNGTVLSADNAAYVNNIGLCIMVGNPLVLLIKRYFNFKLIAIFVDADLKFDFGIDLFGVFLGLLLIVFGTIYGQACAAHKQETAIILRDTQN